MSNDYKTVPPIADLMVATLEALKSLGKTEGDQVHLSVINNEIAKNLDLSKSVLQKTVGEKKHNMFTHCSATARTALQFVDLLSNPNKGKGNWALTKEGEIITLTKKEARKFFTLYQDVTKKASPKKLQELIKESLNNVENSIADDTLWVEVLDGIDLSNTKKQSQLYIEKINKNMDQVLSNMQNEKFIKKIEPNLWALTNKSSESSETEDKTNSALKSNPKNLIYYGPPGTGKTYKSISKAVEICIEDPTLFKQEYEDEDDRPELEKKFRELSKEGRIEFVTFHQSFSYEDFVEGLRPTTDKTNKSVSSVGFSLEPHSGVFIKICDRAIERLTLKCVNRKQSVYIFSAHNSLIHGEFIKSCLDNEVIFIDGANTEDWTNFEFKNKQEFEDHWKNEFNRNSSSDLNNMRQIYDFCFKIEIGDYIALSDEDKNIVAIGETVGQYYMEVDGSHATHRRKVNWLKKDVKEDYNSLFAGNFSDRPVKKLIPSQIDWDSLDQIISEEYLYDKEKMSGIISKFQNKKLNALFEENPRTFGTMGHKSYEILLESPNGIMYEDYIEQGGRWQDLHWDFERERVSLEGEETSNIASETADNFVIIIDEINRANISGVFGELITLIESDKRIGEKHEIFVHLPYSGRKFGVPKNLYIIGTMNTADRSIALMDNALRRRFEFEEIMTDYSLVNIIIENFNLGKYLTRINRKIEQFLGKDFQIGHSWFMDCKSIEKFYRVIRHALIPLLSEHFYDDLSKVAFILEDNMEDNVGSNSNDNTGENEEPNSNEDIGNSEDSSLNEDTGNNEDSNSTISEIVDAKHSNSKYSGCFFEAIEIVHPKKLREVDAFNRILTPQNSWQWNVKDKFQIEKLDKS